MTFVLNLIESCATASHNRFLASSSLNNGKSDMFSASLYFIRDLRKSAPSHRSLNSNNVGRNSTSYCNLVFTLLHNLTFSALYFLLETACLRQTAPHMVFSPATSCSPFHQLSSFPRSAFAFPLVLPFGTLPFIIASFCGSQSLLLLQRPLTGIAFLPFPQSRLWSLLRCHGQ